MNTKHVKTRLLLLFMIPLTGALSSSIAYLFIKGILELSARIQLLGPYYLLLPLAFLASQHIVSRCQEKDSLNNEKIMDMLHQSRGNVTLQTLPYRLGAFVVTALLGGSVGKAGPSAQIGAGISNGLLRIKPGLFTPFQQEVLILCGISGGFTAVFGTPFFGAVFANKILWTHGDTYKRLLPSLLASFSGILAMRTLGFEPMSVFQVGSLEIDLHLIFLLVLFGIFLAAQAFIFIGIVKTVDRTVLKLFPTKQKKAIAGGVVLILLVLFTGKNDMLGLSQPLLYRSLSGEAQFAPMPYLKMLATSITFASGGKGGILAPIFIIGSTAGSLYAQMIQGVVGLFAELGMVGFFAAATNAPLSALALCLELFGFQMLVPGLIVIAVSHILVRRSSVFTTQIRKVYSRVERN
ncbi:chloride channel protein [Alkalibacter rhizosphaerae]|uniref:Chloride channel protein n=1 Tax=Alkalibacter rhizosphaerae TaxID=2815577 RepID=A0A975AIJ0_9FIRM|nr:chloride channel protein [Alkalibacter rhizosphaerae]QSX08575.1 chloride channel protein [Alkalibacter rhizosphaerae]